jgi:Predicted membrane protein
VGADLGKVVLETAKTLSQPTVGELVDALVKQKGLQEKDATKAVYVEYKKGTLNLTDAHPPSNLASYFFNLENAWFWGVTGLVAVTVLVVFMVNSSALLYVRYVLGGVFVLFIPGFLFISALYARSEEMYTLERVALSIGLSLAVVPLIGLVLNYTPWGIRLEPIMVSLALFSEVMAVICVVRRFRYYRLNLS